MKKEFRADHIGSLLRPPELLQARAAHGEGRLPAEELQRLEDLAIRHAIQRQRDIGLDILSDGEMRRGSWLTDMAEAVDGFVRRHGHDWTGRVRGGAGSKYGQGCGAKLRKARKLTGEELPALQDSPRDSSRLRCRRRLISCWRVTSRGLPISSIPLMRICCEDLVEIVRDEIEWLVGAGVIYIQFDAPYYSHYLDPAQRAAMRARGLIRTGA